MIELCCVSFVGPAACLTKVILSFWISNDLITPLNWINSKRRCLKLHPEKLESEKPLAWCEQRLISAFA